MYIKPNVIGASIIIAVSCQAIDFSARVNSGMATNSYQLVPINHLNANQVADYSATVTSHDRKDVANSIGYNMPEFLDLFAYGSFSPAENFYVQPYINLKLLGYRADVGTELFYSSAYFDDAVNIKAFLNGYRSLFSKGVTYDKNTINLDAGAKVDITMSPYFSIYLEVKHPFISGYTLSINDRDIPVSNIPSMAIGASVNILADYGNLKDDSSSYIIQEPISIPVVEIKLESPPRLEDLVVPRVVIDESKDTIDSNEDLGWFAWLIEFIAKLFRF